jgi:excisionase family DNA binding protein
MRVPKSRNATYSEAMKESIEAIASTKVQGATDGASSNQNDKSANELPATIPRVAFSVSEIADMLGVSTKTVRRLVSRNLLRPSRALRHLLIPKTEIERFLRETTVE